MYSLIIAILGLCGFLIAFYIWREKHNDVRNIVCPLHGDCAAVIGTKYGTTFGISNELLGMLYYAAVTLVFAAKSIFSVSLPPIIDVGFVVSGAGAVLFSTYLTGIQLFVLKKFCTWCVVSAIISVAIFGLFLVLYGV